MFKKANKALDAFSFSLGGMGVASPFVAIPVIANDRINKIRDAHLSMLQTRRSEGAKTTEEPSAGEADLCLQNA